MGKHVPVIDDAESEHKKYTRSAISSTATNFFVGIFQKPTFGAGSSFGGMSALSQPQQPAAAPSGGSGFAA